MKWSTIDTCRIYIMFWPNKHLKNSKLAFDKVSSDCNYGSQYDRIGLSGNLQELFGRGIYEYSIFYKTVQPYKDPDCNFSVCNIQRPKGLQPYKDPDCNSSACNILRPLGFQVHLFIVIFTANFQANFQFVEQIFGFNQKFVFNFQYRLFRSDFYYEWCSSKTVILFISNIKI